MTGAGVAGVAGELWNTGSGFEAAADLEMNAGTVQQSVNIHLIDKHSRKRGLGV